MNQRSTMIGAWALALAPIALSAQTTPELRPATFSGLEARAIGPAITSGRITTIDAVTGPVPTLWVGAAGGGVWKSDDGGVTFAPVFDDHTQSIGAIAVDPSAPDTVWVGTGEGWTRNSVSAGDGVYRTVDGGESWEHMGLPDSERITRIRVNPEDGGEVFVCATGPLWSEGGERGVYRTTDAGESWTPVLEGSNATTGCSDLAMDPQDPDILYAGMWDFRRWPWSFRSGGPGSGLYRSRDGGESWEELTNGLPEGEKGRIAVAVAPSRANRVYALVEAEETALYRSDDLGESWEEVNASSNITMRPFYFALLEVDPSDADRVYKPGYTLTVSEDGGESFTSPFTSFGTTVHADHHALWIDPSNPNFMVLGTDGGVYLSDDRGGHWRHVRSLPVAQFYELSVDMDRPYNVYGGLQDNGTWTGPSQSPGGIRNSEWRNIGGGDGFHAYVDPHDADFVYVEYQGGNVMRLHRPTGETKLIQPYAAAGNEELRFNWNTPLHLGVSGALYAGAQYLFVSFDRGESWSRISPDLTTDDPEKQKQEESGGLTVDNTSAENHTTIFTISESPVDPGVIWVGTDDGNLQVTTDRGAEWTNVVANVPDLPDHTWVSHVEASPHDAAVAFAAFDGHATGDFATYFYRTEDYGRSWTPLATSEMEGWARVIVQDPVQPDLLFAGTENGLWISIDRGTSWARFESGLPAEVPVHDLVIHPRDHDLVIGTHGRGAWILDDITPLRHLTPDVLAAEVEILPTRDAVLSIPAGRQIFPGDGEFVGANPLADATLAYYQQKRHLFGDLFVEIYDDEGALVSTIPGSKSPGVNRVELPTRKRAPKMPPANSLVPVFAQGPRLPEGTYTAKLRKGDEVRETTVRLVPDPRSPHSPEDRAVQQAASLELYDMMERLTYIAEAAEELQQQVDSLAENARGRTRSRAEDFSEDLIGFRAGLVSSGEGGLFSGSDQLREKLTRLYGAVVGYTGRPTDSQLEEKDRLAERLRTAEARFAELTAGPRLRRISEELAVLTREEWEARSR